MKKKAIFLLFSATIAFTSSRPDEALNVLTEIAGESCFIDQNNNPAGYSIEIANEIMKRSGEISKINILPWSRAYLMAQNQPNTVLFATARYREREKLFKWAGPIGVVRYGLYSNSADTIKINSIQEAKKVKSIGVIAQDVREQILRKMGFNNLDPMHGTNAIKQNIQKLQAGRITLMASTETSLLVAAKSMGIPRDKFREVLFIDTLYTYFSFSPNTDDKIVSKWQAALDEMKKDGTYERIMRKYESGRASITYEKPFPENR